MPATTHDPKAPDPEIIGVVKRLDGKGRLAIPQSQQAAVGIGPNAELSIVVYRGAIWVRPL